LDTPNRGVVDKASAIDRIGVVVPAAAAVRGWR
jgi:hypothetical protein